jgi:hypothetical protein
MRSQPDATPSGFFVLRTPLLPLTAVTAWGVPADLTKPAAEATLSSSVVWNLHRGASALTPTAAPTRAT